MKDATSMKLERTPASAGRARRVTRSMLDGRVSVDAAEIVELLVSEIVTNAILHATSAPELSVMLFDDRVRVEVRDEDDDRAPRLRPSPEPTATSGRGLAIVDALSSAWGIDTQRGIGKCVWFEVGLA
jgi:anti-sigma regulatory factor (Ser/Thr protein kinase)